jgi:hypothetical protein
MIVEGAGSGYEPGCAAADALALVGIPFVPLTDDEDGPEGNSA